METKNRLFSLEYFLTVLLFLPLLFFFPQEISFLRPYFFIGIFAGAAFAYFTEKLFSLFKKPATLIASLLILSWTVYSIFNSTFFYREVIIACIKSLSFLVVVNSFGSSLEGCLSSMQIFSILLFFCLCALTKEYSNYFLILTAGFVFDLSILVRLKVDYILGHFEQARVKRQAVNLPMGIVLLAGIFAAWILFLKVPLREIKTWGYLQEEELVVTEEESLSKKDIILSDDQLRKELTSLTFRLSSVDQMHQVLASIQELLVKDPEYAIQANYAKRNILKMLDDPLVMQGRRDEKVLKDSLQAYVDKKILKNLSLAKEKIGKIIQSSQLGLWQKLAVLNSVNKVEYSSSLRGIDQYSQQIKDTIAKEHLPQEAKKQLNQFGGKLKEWKAYQLYRKKMVSLKKKISSLDKDKNMAFNEMFLQISVMDKIAESNLTAKKIEKLRQEYASQESQILSDAQEAFGLKKEMLIFKENNQLREKLEDAKDGLGSLGNLEELLSFIEESKNPQETVDKIAKLLEEINAANLQLPQEAREMLKDKLDSLIRKANDAVKKQIEDNHLGQSGKNLLGDLEKTITENNQNKIKPAFAKIQRSIEAFYKQGNLLREVKEDLINNVQVIEQLLVMKSQLESATQQKSSVSGFNALDYAEKIRQLLEASGAQPEQKEILDKLLEKLTSAQTIAQVDDVLSAVNQQLDAWEKNKNAKDIKKLNDLVQEAAQLQKKFILAQSSVELRKNIENLKSVSARSAGYLEQSLDKAQEMKNRQDLVKKIEALSDSFESKQEEIEKSTEPFFDIQESASNEETLKLYLLPDYVVLSLNSSILLQNLAIYNNFIRDISSELEWISVDPTVAFVNQRGLVTALGIGQTEIVCQYGGLIKTNCKVIVVEAIPQTEAVYMRSQLGKSGY
jgi:hypothetical protein